MPGDGYGDAPQDPDACKSDASKHLMIDCSSFGPLNGSMLLDSTLLHVLWT